jgi:hypothetical protein
MTEKPKRLGRPPTGRAQMVSVRFPPSELAEIDALAAHNSMSRSDVIRHLVALGRRALHEEPPVESKSERKVPDHIKEAADRAEALARAKRPRW